MSIIRPHLLTWSASQERDVNRIEPRCSFFVDTTILHRNIRVEYKTLVDSINSLPYLYIGGDSKLTAEETNTVSIDNVTLIRNMMEEKDWNKTIGGNGGGDEAFKNVEFVKEDSTPTTEIGTSDCSAAWWTSFSDYYRIPANGSIHLKFTNHTSGAGNWNNWNLCVSTDDERAGGNYSEYFVIRSDAYGWDVGSECVVGCDVSKQPP